MALIPEGQAATSSIKDTNQEKASELSKNEKSHEGTGSCARIGWAFLAQYYSFLNKDPSRLHCFYTKRSTLLHSTEGEEAEACFGQQQIHSKIMSLDFEDCKVYISQVDSQSSAEGGIVVQVIGEMSNKGKPWRKFAQTFFLAEQPTGYFVLNDICRYLKEEGDEEEVAAAAAVIVSPESVNSTLVEGSFVVSAYPSSSTEDHQTSSSTVTTISAEEFIPSESIPSNYPTLSSPSSLPALTNGLHQDQSVIATKVTTPTILTDSIPSTAIPTEAQSKPKPEVATIPTPPITEAIVPISTSKSEPKVVEAEITEPVVLPLTKLVASAPPTPLESTSTSTPISTSTSISPSVTLPSTIASTSTVISPKTSSSTTTPVSQPAAPVVKTWATLAAAASTKKIVPVTTTTTANASTTTTSSTTTTPKTQYHANVMAITSTSCFVKGVIESVNEKVLKDLLIEKYGAMREFDVVKSRACAFVEFEKLDGARKAIQASLRIADGGEGGLQVISEPGGEPALIHVVTKKAVGDRPGTNNNNNNNNNSNNRSRGGSGVGAGGENRGGQRNTSGNTRGGASTGPGGVVTPTEDGVKVKSSKSRGTPKAAKTSKAV